MEEAQFLHYALALLGIVFTLLIGVLKWGANQLLGRMDSLTSAIRALGGVQQALDLRLTSVEARCNFEHGMHAHRRSTDPLPGSVQ